MGTIAVFTWMIVMIHSYPSVNRNNGILMRNYGAGILDSLPHDSILLSHSDMQWNAVRYLQTCEGLRPDIIHLNFQVNLNSPTLYNDRQLMPYPWFASKQVQANLYVYVD